VVIGNDEQLKKKILQCLHDSPIGEYSGLNVTYWWVGQLFYWKGLKKDVTRFVMECTTCQRCKHKQIPYPGLLQPLEIPSQVWELISMDFVKGLPKSKGVDTLLVVVDKLIKFSHFLTLAHPFIAIEVARKLMDSVFKIHGLEQFQRELPFGVPSA